MKTILIIDDDQAVVQLLEIRLRGKYITHATTDPKSAVSRLKTTRTDLVLCDLDMPVMNGSETARAIRKEFPSLPIVFLTALVTPTEAKDGAIKGERVIAKAAPISELADCIESIVGK